MSGFGAAAARLAGLAWAGFGLDPERFWNATPTELAGLLDALGGPAEAPPDRDAIARLMEAFPDG